MTKSPSALYLQAMKDYESGILEYETHLLGKASGDQSSAAQCGQSHGRQRRDCDPGGSEEHGIAGGIGAAAAGIVAAGTDTGVNAGAEVGAMESIQGAAATAAVGIMGIGAQPQYVCEFHVVPVSYALDFSSYSSGVLVPGHAINTVVPKMTTSITISFPVTTSYVGC